MSLTYLLTRHFVIPQPIPVENLLVEDLSDGDARMGGSFKTAISRLGTGEYNIFCLIVTGKRMLSQFIVYRCNTDTALCRSC